MIAVAGAPVIVSGNAEDLGYAIAGALVEAGARVVLIDDNPEALDAVITELSQKGEITGIEADFADATAMEAAAQRALSTYGTPRALVHNAATFREVPLTDLTFPAWRSEVDTILQSAFVLSKAVWPSMTKAGSGSIVFVSSGSALNGFADEAAYVAGKHAQEGLMKVLALEGKPFNVAVNSMTTGAPVDGPLAYTYSEAMLKVMVKPSVLAPAFVFAAGFDAAFSSGQRLNAFQLSEAVRS